MTKEEFAARGDEIEWLCRWALSAERRTDVLDRAIKLLGGDVRDLAQQAMLQVCTRLESGPIDATLGTIVVRAIQFMAGHVIWAHNRKKMRVRYANDKVYHIAERQFYEHRERENNLPSTEEIDLAIEKLPEQDRRILRMHFWEDVPLKHIWQQDGTDRAKRIHRNVYPVLRARLEPAEDPD